VCYGGDSDGLANINLPFYWLPVGRPFSPSPPPHIAMSDDSCQRTEKKCNLQASVRDERLDCEIVIFIVEAQETPPRPSESCFRSARLLAR